MDFFVKRYEKGEGLSQAFCAASMGIGESSFSQRREEVERNWKIHEKRLDLIPKALILAKPSEETIEEFLSRLISEHPLTMENPVLPQAV